MPGIALFKKGFFVLVAAVLIATQSLSASAGDINVNLSSPSTNTSGSYTVTWTAGMFYYLEEKKNSGSWTTVYSGTGSSKSFSGKGAGTYNYRIRLYLCLPPMMSCINLYSDSVTTVVNVPVPSKPGNITGATSYSYTTTSGSTIALAWPASTGTVTKYQLQEKVNSGSYVTVHNSTSRSKTRPGKLAGTYS